jgi:hypothetical protein
MRDKLMNAKQEAFKEQQAFKDKANEDATNAATTIAKLKATIEGQQKQANLTKQWTAQIAEQQAFLDNIAKEQAAIREKATKKLKEEADAAAAKEKEMQAALAKDLERAANMKAQTEAAMAAREKARKEAEAELNKDLEKMNEQRKAIRAETDKFEAERAKKEAALLASIEAMDDQAYETENKLRQKMRALSQENQRDIYQLERRVKLLSERLINLEFRLRLVQAKLKSMTHVQIAQETEVVESLKQLNSIANPRLTLFAATEKGQMRLQQKKEEKKKKLAHARAVFAAKKAAEAKQTATFF